MKKNYHKIALNYLKMNELIAKLKYGLSILNMKITKKILFNIRVCFLKGYIENM